MTVFDQKEFINNDHLLTFYFIPNSRLLSLLERPLHVIEKTVLQDKIPPPIKTFSTAYLQGVLQKKYIQLETFIFEKVWNKFKQNFYGCKNILWKYLLAKYLGTLFNYDLINYYCQFLMTFISSNIVLVRIVNHLKHFEGTVVTSIHNKEKFIVFS